MSQLPIESAIPRFKANEERIDFYVNGPGYTSSNGVFVPGLKDIFVRYNLYKMRGEWVSGTSYAFLDIFTLTNVAYIVLKDHVATTIEEDLLNSKIGVWQGATVFEVTYTATGEGSYSIPVNVKLNDIPAVSDYVSIQEAVNAKNDLLVPEGFYNVPDNFVNRYGAYMNGPGYIMQPVDTSDLTKGRFRNIFNDVDRYQRTFGDEYAFAISKHYYDTRMQIPPAIPLAYLVGDSTIFGDYIADENMIPKHIFKYFVEQKGFQIEVVSLAVSGSGAANFSMTDEQILSSNMIIISYGINDLDFESFITSYRSMLGRIRGLRNYLETTVVIKTSNACGATQDGRDETQAYPQRQVLRSLAREFKCVFFDTPSFFADPRDLASGVWDDNTTPPTRIAIGWMDSFRRSDPAYIDPTKYNSSVHPLEIGNMWIWGRLVDTIFAPGNQYNSNNKIRNLVGNSLLSSDKPNVKFQRGINISRASASNGFPIDGEAVTISASDGTGLQLLYGLGVKPSFSFRHVDLISGGQNWGEWSEIGTYSLPILETVNSWVKFVEGIGISVTKSGRLATLSGRVKGGVTSAGTTIFILNSEFVPDQDSTFVVACGANFDQFATVIVTTSGVVAINNCPTNTGLSLSGITFRTNV